MTGDAEGADVRAGAPLRRVRMGPRTVWLALPLGLGLAASAAAQPQTFEVDASASHVRIELGRAGLMKFLGHDHTIVAPLRDGRIEVDRDHPDRSQVWLRWSAAALAIVPGSEPADDVPEVTARMLGPDVLDVESHPDIVFVSDAVEARATGPDAYALHVRGTLRVRGHPRRVEVDLRVRLEAARLQASGETRLELRDLGISPPSVAGVVKVADEFGVRFEIEARR